MGFAAEMRDFVQGWRAGRSMIRDKTPEEREREERKKAEDEARKRGSDGGAEGRKRNPPARASTAIPDDGQGGNATHGGYTGGGDAAGQDSPRERAGFSHGGEGKRAVDGLTDNAIASVDTTGDQALLAMLRKDSGEHSYGAMTFKKDGTPGGRANFEGMTIAQVFDHQNWMKENGYASTAVGAYQTIRGTLGKAVEEMGLDPKTTKFDKTTQDRVALHLANKRGYADFKAGKIDAQTFAKNLASEWAILPMDASGKGRYDGFNGNKASVGWNNVLATLEKAKTGTPATGVAGLTKQPLSAGEDTAVAAAEAAAAAATASAEAEKRRKTADTAIPEQIVPQTANVSVQDEEPVDVGPRSGPIQVASLDTPTPKWMPQEYAGGGSVQATAQAEVKPGVNAPWPGEPIRGGVPARPSSFNFQGAPQTMVGNYVSPNGAVQGTPEFDVEMLRAQNGAWGFGGNAHDTQQYGGWQGGGNPAPAYMEYWERPYGTPPGYNGGYYADAPVHETNNPAPGPQMRRTALTDRIQARHSDPIPPHVTPGGNAPAAAQRPAAQAAPRTGGAAQTAARSAAPQSPQSASVQPSATEARASAIPESAGEDPRWADIFRERRRESQARAMDAQSRYILDQERAAQQFDPEAYLKYNPDLKMSAHEAGAHYNTMGKAEGRVWWDRDRQVMPPSTLPESATVQERIADMKARREQSKVRLQNPVNVADAESRTLVRTQPYGSFTRGSSGPPYQRAITGYNDRGMPEIEEETGNIWDGYYGDSEAEYGQAWTRGVRQFADGGMVEEEHPAPPARPNFERFRERPTIDLDNRPEVRNDDGTTSTVRSITVNIDGEEVVIPTVSDDGRIMSDEEAIDAYLQSGSHMGKFDTQEDAGRWSEQVHDAHAKRYAEGGVVEEDEETTGAIPETPMPPPRPHRREALHAYERQRPAAPIEDDPHASNPAAATGYNPRNLAKVDPDAVRGGMRAITKVFGFDQRPSAGIGPGSQGGNIEGFARNEGAFTTEEVRAAKQTVDPGNELTEGERTLAALHAGYKFYEERGEFRKADVYAARMLMHIKKVIATGGIMAQAALENGDVPRAAKIFNEAHDHVPDGNRLRLINADKNGAQFQLIDENGDVTKEGRATIDEMMRMATGMQNGTEWFRAAGAIASKPHSQRMAEERLRLQERRADEAHERGLKNQERAERDYEDRKAREARMAEQWQKEHEIRLRTAQRQEAEAEARRKNEEEKKTEQERLTEGYDDLKIELEDARAALDAAADNPEEWLAAERRLNDVNAKAQAWIAGHPKRMQQFGRELGVRAPARGRAAATPGGNRSAIPEQPTMDPGATGPTRNMTADQKEMAGIDQEVRRKLRQLQPQTDEHGKPMDMDTLPDKAFDIIADGEYRKHADPPPSYTERDSINGTIAKVITDDYTNTNTKVPKGELLSVLTDTVQDIVRGNNMDTPTAVRILRQAYDPKVPFRRGEKGTYQFGNNKPIRLPSEALRTILMMRDQAKQQMDADRAAAEERAKRNPQPRKAIPDNTSTPDDRLLQEERQREAEGNARQDEIRSRQLDGKRAAKGSERERLIKAIGPEEYEAALKKAPKDANGEPSLSNEQLRTLLAQIENRRNRERELEYNKSPGALPILGGGN